MHIPHRRHQWSIHGYKQKGEHTKIFLAGGSEVDNVYGQARLQSHYTSAMPALIQTYFPITSFLKV